MKKKIELGDLVQDVHTGFKGTAVVYSKFFNGCEQFEVAPKVDKDNKVSDSIGIDIQSLKIIKRGKIGLDVDKIKKDKIKTKQDVGGPNRISICKRGY